MNFSKKLDILMNITNSKNTELASYVMLDASYISRLRHGKRNLPKDQNYVDAMVLYFVKRLNSYQVENLKKLLINNLPNEYEELDFNQLLYNWLIDDDAKNTNEILNELSFIEVNKSFDFNKKDNSTGNIVIDKVNTYYGFEGLRKAAIDFLLFVLNSPNTHTLSLFSDENMSWLGDDIGYFCEWKNLMTKVIEKGNKIKVIHTINRNLDELITSIKGWIPLYMSGAISSYYYPRKRDGIFKRTLFIAPNISAITCSSVGDMKDTMPITLISNKKTINGFQEEFNSYLSLCKPLVKKFDINDKSKYYRFLQDFESENVDTLIKLDSFSIITMPASLRESLINKISSPKAHKLSEYLYDRVLNFKKTLETSKYIEIIEIPSIDLVEDFKFNFDFSFMFAEQETFYTKAEFIEHLKHIIFLLQNLENYYVFFYENEENYNFYIKKGVGIIVSSRYDLSSFIKVDELNIVSGFEDYLYHELQLNINKMGSNCKSSTILKLKEIINQLEHMNIIS